jgi:hypothetical protein
MPEKNTILNDVAFWINAVVGIGAGAVTLFVSSIASQMKGIVDRFSERDEEFDRQLERLRNDVIELYNMDRQQGAELAGFQARLFQIAERLDNLLSEHRRIHK